MSPVSRPPTGLQPITSRSVSDQVTAQMRSSIVSGDLRPGATLSLRKIAEQLDVSLIPVRDAVRVLQGEGLVVNPPGRSAEVAPLDLDELGAVYRLRRRIEPDLAQRSVNLLTDAEFDRLDGAAEQLGAAERSMNDIYDDHRAFHLALLAPAASAWDERILTVLWHAAERYIRIGFGLLDPDPHEHVRRRDAHRHLVDEFRRRDPHAAAAVMDDHLVENERLAREILAGIGAADGGD